MAASSTPRTRRAPDEARRQILDAATQLLAEGGPAAVQVRAVARRVGVTDATVNHHVGTRDELLLALLRHGGRLIKAELGRVCDEWAAGGGTSRQLVDALAHFYRQGWAELGLGLFLAGGGRDETAGSGMLDVVVETLHARRAANARLRGAPAPCPLDTQLVVAALHQAMFGEPLHGGHFRASAGIPPGQAGAAEAQLRWWADVIDRFVEGDDAISPPEPRRTRPR